MEHRSSKIEWTLVTVVGLISVVLGFPEEWIVKTGIHKDLLVATLGILIVVSLFFYLRFTLFLMVILLVVGANLNSQYAEAMGVAQLPVIVTLVIMVGASLINHIVHILPDGDEAPLSTDNASKLALFYAIKKGNVKYTAFLLGLKKIDPNLVDHDGNTALHQCVMRGQTEIVDILLKHGASVVVANDKGETPIELAMQYGYSQLTKKLQSARKQQMGEGGDLDDDDTQPATVEEDSATVPQERTHKQADKASASSPPTSPRE